MSHQHNRGSLGPAPQTMTLPCQSHTTITQTTQLEQVIQLFFIPSHLNADMHGWMQVLTQSSFLSKTKNIKPLFSYIQCSFQKFDFCFFMSDL